MKYLADDGSRPEPISKKETVLILTLTWNSGKRFLVVRGNGYICHGYDQRTVAAGDSAFLQAWPNFENCHTP